MIITGNLTSFSPDAEIKFLTSNFNSNLNDFKLNLILIFSLIEVIFADNQISFSILSYFPQISL